MLIVLPELSYLFFFHYAWGFTCFEYGKIIKQARSKLLETRGTKWWKRKGNTGSGPPIQTRASGNYNEITSFLYLLKMTPFHLELVLVFLEPLLQRPQGNDQIWSSVLLILANLLQSFATVFSWLEKKRIKCSQISLSLNQDKSWVALF